LIEYSSLKNYGINFIISNQRGARQQTSMDSFMENGLIL